MPRFRRLYPEPGTVSVRELAEALRPGEGATRDRPRTLVNFIASVDGRATFQGRSGPLGNEADRQLFHTLRERVDAVMAGTGTLRIERYGRLLGKAERRDRRSEEGMSPEPLACLVTRSGDVPLDIPLFAEAEARVVIFSSRNLDTSACAAQVSVVRLDMTELTLTTVLQRLRTAYGVRSLLCEGGPTLFGSLLHEGLVDELFLTVTPKLVGGGNEPSITTGPELTVPGELVLIWALEQDGALFMRYAVGRS